jgi:hypothetical protein
MQNGEVRTPLPIIEELLTEMRLIDPTIFSNPNLKWFDNANGVGNFPIVLYHRLMDGLINWEPDFDKREKHILENMIFTSELSIKNCFVYQQIFNINGKYKLNMYQGDSLLLDMQKEWGIDKFDVILGNPPYNSGGIRSNTGKKNQAGSKTIWTDFVNYSLEHLKESGYLIYINPLTWTKKTNEMFDVYTQRCIKYLQLWDDSYNVSIMRADIPVSLYILQNKPFDNTETKIVSKIKRRKIDNVVYSVITNNHSIPQAFYTIFDKIYNFIKKYNLELETYSTCVSKDKGKKTFPLPEEYEAEDMLGVDTYRIADGIQVSKMKNVHKHMFNDKLIFANKRSFVGSFLDDGKLGLIGNHKYYILDNYEDLRILQTFFDTKISRIIDYFTKYEQSYLDKDAFTFIPNFSKIDMKFNKKDVKVITDEILYKWFKLSKEEIEMLEKLDI